MAPPMKSPAPMTATVALRDGMVSSAIWDNDVASPVSLINILISLDTRPNRRHNAAMRWESLSREHCSLARTLAVVGDRWTLLVLRDAFMGIRRFDDFEKSLKIARRVLSERLALLVEEGILRRVAYHEK